MTPLSIRPLSIRLQVGYMATAMRAAGGNPVPNCAASNTYERLTSSGIHPYQRLWRSINDFYKSQGFDKLCDAEIQERFNAAMSVGFTTAGGRNVPATAVHSAASQWDKQGWRRYEHQHAGRVRIAKRAGLLGLAFVGIPLVSDL